jgi:AraC-like DNA-binding protein
MQREAENFFQISPRPSGQASSIGTPSMHDRPQFSNAPGELLFAKAVDGMAVRAARSQRPGGTVFAHYEDVHRIFITLEGGTRATIAEIDDHPTVLRPDEPGAVTIVPAGTRRRVLMDDTDFVILTIGMTDDFLRDSLAEEPGDIPAPDWRPPLVQNVIHPWLLRLGLAFKLAGMEGAPAMQMETLGLMLARHIGMRERQGGRSGGLDPVALNRVVQLMNDRIAHDVSLTELAAEAGLGVSAFGRAFAKSLGLSPFRFFAALRMRRAQEMLAYTARPLAEIAGEIGYADQAHFTAAFTRHTGISPGKWRAEFGTAPTFMPISRKTPPLAVA